ncbi:hypothetical protein chiPu_0022517, partial [Chiloscyllium punctatum]|nr:hypothetical protein [Chiloscyllium punctatum]
PLYLPVRVLITAETFTLSSNIIVDTATFHLRFILDDSAVYLCNRCNTETVDLKKGNALSVHQPPPPTSSSSYPVRCVACGCERGLSSFAEQPFPCQSALSHTAPH